MHFRIQIVPSGDYDEVVRRVLEHVQADPRILYLSAGRLASSLVFCEDAEDAADNRKRYEERDALDPWLGLVRISPRGLLLDQECSEEQRSLLVSFGKWVLQAFAPCRVRDVDTAEDLTTRASEDPDGLFNEI